MNLEGLNKSTGSEAAAAAAAAKLVETRSAGFEKDQGGAQNKLDPVVTQRGRACNKLTSPVDEAVASAVDDP